MGFVFSDFFGLWSMCRTCPHWKQDSLLVPCNLLTIEIIGISISQQKFLNITCINSPWSWCTRTCRSSRAACAFMGFTCLQHKNSSMCNSKMVEYIMYPFHFVRQTTVLVFIHWYRKFCFQVWYYVLPHFSYCDQDSPRPQYTYLGLQSDLAVHETWLC